MSFMCCAVSLQQPAVGDDHGLQRLAAASHGAVLQLVHHILALQHTAKNDCKYTQRGEVADSETQG